MNKLYPVYTLENECQDCYKCVRHCPVKAIKIEDGHASVISEKCIACGLCIKVCPQNAKKVRNDIEKVKGLIKTGKKIYASIAPSWISSFDVSKEKMITGLKNLGFHEVSETSLGAQEVSIETAKILDKTEQKLLISSACPAVVEFIRYYYPEYTDNITKVLSPALTHAKMLKKLSNESSHVVFIGPCSAKKKEADKHPELIDIALTFSELQSWLNEEFINLTEIEEDSNAIFFPEEAFEGNLYPIEGGMNETIKKSQKKNTQLLSISSIHSLKESLKEFSNSKIDTPIFIEALACDGGCINGPCIPEKKANITSITKIMSYSKNRDSIPTKSSISLKESYKPEKKIEEVFSIEEIIEKMKSIGKYNIDDELNCGGCGYDTCRDFAKALLEDKAEPSMCVSYMRKIAMKKAGAMLRCMPSGTVVIDSNFKVIETNEAFIKMFAKDLYEIFTSREEGISGASINKIIPCTDIFQSALTSGKDIHKERYSINNKLYDISAFTIEKKQIVGAIFTDVTQTEMKRDEIAKKAQSVISKNIATVQEIACLLGEHMVDTELILNSISEGFESESIRDKDDA